MGRRLMRMGFPPGGRKSLYRRILDTSPVAFWTCSDPVGSTVVTDSSGNGRNGPANSYINVVLGQPGIDGKTSCYTAGDSTSWCNVYSASLSTRFQAADGIGVHGTRLQWCKMDTGAWAGAQKRYFDCFVTYNTDYIEIVRHVNPGVIGYIRRAKDGDVVNEYDYSVPGGGVDLEWFCVAMTWDQTTPPSGEMKAYYNGAQVGPTQTGLGIWHGSGFALNPARALLGIEAVNLATNHKGWIQYSALWDRVLDAATIKRLSTR